MAEPMEHEFIYDYILSGKAMVTILNTETNNQITVIVRRKSTGIWYVYHAAEYLGYIRSDLFIPHKEISSQHYTDIARRWSWIWKLIALKALPETIEVYHHDNCGYCGRKLTDADSIRTGIGPTCRRKLLMQSI